MIKYMDSFLSHCKKGLSTLPVNLISYLLIYSIYLRSLRAPLLVIIIVYPHQVSISTWALIPLSLHFEVPLYFERQGVGYGTNNQREKWQGAEVTRVWASTLCQCPGHIWQDKVAIPILEWHCPAHKNEQAGVCKAASLMKLGEILMKSW